MYRATTPTHNFVFDEDVSGASEILVTYAQKGTVLVEKSKTNGDFTFTEQTIDDETKYVATCVLTQAETNLFTVEDPFCRGDRVECQVRLLRSDGTALASKVAKIVLRDVLNDEVLT